MSFTRFASTDPADLSTLLNRLGDELSADIAGVGTPAVGDVEGLAAALADASFAKPSPGEFDLDAWRLPIVTNLGAPFPVGWQNVPAGITTSCTFICNAAPGANWGMQQLIQYGSNPMWLWRTSRTTVVWNPWNAVPMGLIAGVMAAHAAWETRFINAMGGPVDTGGLGAVSLRFDHGLTNIKSKLLAGLRSRKIVPVIALNARNWSLEENVGATQSEVNSWVQDGSVEIWNHSATHGGGMDAAQLRDEIVTGRLELESQLPAAAPIWGFAPPGVTEGWDGFNGGNSPEAWATTSGQLILANHAVAAGYVGGPLRTLDGTLRQGLTHVTIERMTVSAIKAQIDQAVTERKGLQLMLHPRLIDTGGTALTTAQFFEVMDYLVQLRSTGKLALLSPNRLVLADATRTPRDTGWREIASTVPGYISGSLTIRREGNRVWLRVFDLLAADQATTWNTYAGLIPDGFRVDLSGYTYFTLAAQASTYTPGPLRMDRNGTCIVYGSTGGKRAAGTFSWTTADPFPTTTIGAPA